MRFDRGSRTANFAADIERGRHRSRVLWPVRELCMGWAIDWNYRFDPDWAPPGAPVKPWFLLGELPPWTMENYWQVVLHYRAEKIAFVRKQLEGVDRPAELRRIIARIWDGVSTNRQRFGRLTDFVQRMMFWPPVEQPLEADAVE